MSDDGARGSAPEGSPDAVPPPTPPDGAPDGPRWIRTTQRALVVVGVFALVVGVWKLVAAKHVHDVARWLVGGIVLHDGIFVPLLTGVLVVGAVVVGGLAARGVRAPRGSGTLLTTGLVVGVVLTFIAWPAIHKKSLGTANPTVLPGDYAARLLGVWIAIVVVVVVGTVLLSVRARGRRRTARPGATRTPTAAPPPAPGSRAS